MFVIYTCNISVSLKRFPCRVWGRARLAPGQSGGRPAPAHAPAPVPVRAARVVMICQLSGTSSRARVSLSARRTAAAPTLPRASSHCTLHTRPTSHSPTGATGSGRLPKWFGRGTRHEHCSSIVHTSGSGASSPAHQHSPRAANSPGTGSISNSPNAFLGLPACLCVNKERKNVEPWL